MIFSQGHALIVGVGADLPNTVNDADGLARILKDKGRCGYPADQVVLLTQEKADRAGILKGLEQVMAAADEQSTVLIYFSGHGYRVASSGKAQHFLMPYGYALGNLVETAIADDEFSAALKEIPAQKLLLLLDCCHAAGIDQTKSPGLTLKNAAIPPAAEDFLAQGKGRVAIASSRAEELSFAGKPYSAFTLALLEALTGSGANEQDGYVRVGDMAMYTSWRVVARTRDRQHPVLRFQEADNFQIAYYAGGDAKPKAPPFNVPTVVEPEVGAWPREAAPGVKHEGGLFLQPAWKVGGNVFQAGRDMTKDTRRAARASKKK
jgi:uncharacterized caspase-like protein